MLWLRFHYCVWCYVMAKARACFSDQNIAETRLKRRRPILTSRISCWSIFCQAHCCISAPSSTKIRLIGCILMQKPHREVGLYLWNFAEGDTLSVFPTFPSNYSSQVTYLLVESSVSLFIPFYAVRGVVHGWDENSFREILFAAGCLTVLE